MLETDVLIVGGGPAGAACAWALKRQGIDCVILDCQVFPRVKLCAGWVPPGVWNDLDIQPDAYPFGLQEFTHLYVSIKGVRLAVPTRQYAIRRIEFDNWLLNRAEVPVVIHHVREIKRIHHRYVVDNTYKAKAIVGAGGTHCPVYRTFFSEQHPRVNDDLIVALEEEFAYPVTDQRCQLWFVEYGLPGYSWYVPKAQGFVNVGVGGKISSLKKNGDHIQRHWAVLVDKLRKLDIVKGYDFHPKGYSYYLRQTSGPVQLEQAYLVGDAAGLATRDLGEGIDVAVKSGLWAAEALIKGTAYTVEGIRKFTLGYEWLRLPWLRS